MDLCLDFTDWIKKNFEPKFCKMIENLLKVKRKSRILVLLWCSLIIYFFFEEAFKSANTMATIASPIGTAFIPTQGS